MASIRKKKTVGGFILTLLALGVWLKTHPASQKPPPVRILFFSNRAGEVAPCSCQGNPKGGLAVWQKQMKALLGEAVPTFVVDGGDTFFSVASHDSVVRKREWNRAQKIAGAYRSLPVDFWVPGERDWFQGPSALVKLVSLAQVQPLALLPPGASTPLKPLVPWKCATRQGASVVFIGIAPAWSGEAIGSPAHENALWWKPLLVQALSEIQRANVEGPLIVLSHLGLEGDKQVAETGLVDVVLGAHSLDVLESPLRVKKTLVGQAEGLGAGIGELVWDPHLRAAHYRLIPIRSQVAPAVPSQKEGAKTAKSTQAKWIADPYVCERCHQAQVYYWRTTAHSGAYLTLYSKKSHFDAECIVCHALGFRQPDGFSKIAQPLEWTSRAASQKAYPHSAESLMERLFGNGSQPRHVVSGRTHAEEFKVKLKRYHEFLSELKSAHLIRRIFMGVQCEHCHQDRVSHLQNPYSTRARVSKPTLRQCQLCHRPPNADPLPQEALKKIACPPLSETGLSVFPTPSPKESPIRYENR